MKNGAKVSFSMYVCSALKTLKVAVYNPYRQSAETILSILVICGCHGYKFVMHIGKKA